MNNENNGLNQNPNVLGPENNVNQVPVTNIEQPVQQVPNIEQPVQTTPIVEPQPVPVMDNVNQVPETQQSLKSEEITITEPVQNQFSEPVVEPETMQQPQVVVEPVKEQSVTTSLEDHPRKKRKVVPFLVFIIILLIIGIVGMHLYYNGYLDKYIGKTSNTESTSEKEKNTTSVSYNKDGEFIQSLMDKILYKNYYSHDEFQLYSKDIVTVDDLSDNYKNNLIVLNMRKSTTEVSSISESNLMKSSKNLFGKNIYSEFPEKLEILCKTFTHDASNKVYTKDLNSGGCGGTGYAYLDYITKVENDDQNIYVYQKVAFQGQDGIYKNVKVKDNAYSTSEMLAEYKQNTMEFNFNVEENLDKMNEYKFTFKYDKENSIYYFDSVEKVK